MLTLARVSAHAFITDPNGVGMIDLGTLGAHLIVEYGIAVYVGCVSINCLIRDSVGRPSFYCNSRIIGRVSDRLRFNLCGFVVTINTPPG